MNFFSILLDALAFRTEGLTNFKKPPLVFWRGVLVMLFVALVVGFFSEGASELERARRPIATADAILTQIQSSLATVQDAQLRQFILNNIREGIQMGLDVAALTPRGGTAMRPLEATLSFLGRWWSTFFVGWWLPFLLFGGIFTQLAARSLGGRGAIGELLGLGALSYSPALLNVVTIGLNLLNQLTSLPGAGALASLVGIVVTVWQIAIYSKAVSIAHEMSLARSVAVIALAFAMIAALALLFFLTLILIIGILFSLTR